MPTRKSPPKPRRGTKKPTKAAPKGDAFPEPLSDATREAVFAMRRARPGVGVVEIAAALGISKGSVSNILRGTGSKAAASFARARRPASPPPDSVDDEDLDGDVVLPPPPENATPQELVAHTEKLARALLKDAHAARENNDPRLASQVTNQASAALTKLFELRPPPVRDPDKDPLNVAAREEVVRRVEALIAREETGRAALRDLEAKLQEGG